MSNRKLQIRLTEFEVESDRFKAKGRWEEPRGEEGEAHRRWVVRLAAKNDARWLYGGGLAGEWRFMELPEAQEFAAKLLEHAEDDADELDAYMQARDARNTALTALETEAYTQHLDTALTHP